MGIFDSIAETLGFGDDENNEETQEQTEETQESEAPEALMNEEEATQEEAPAEEEEESGMQMEVNEAPTATVDIVSKLDELSEGNPDLDWKSSIVDLMELVGIDSSYEHRKELAQEMGIEGYHGTAEQNIELHKAVLQRLAENGGNVPEDLLA
jgi:hypothetical protein